MYGSTERWRSNVPGGIAGRNGPMRAAPGEIEFMSEGVPCAGELYRPQGDPPYPALVIVHGFATTKASLAEEGRLFAASGYLTLAIDFRHFGSSGGSPRHRLWPENEIEDVRAAIDWLEARRETDTRRIGLWGTSFGGGIVTCAAAHDSRVRATVAQAPILDGDGWIRSLNRSSDYAAIKARLLADRRRRAAGGEAEIFAFGTRREDGFDPLPPDPAMVRDMMEWQARAGFPLLHTAPDITLDSFARVMAFDAVRAAAKIAPRAYCIVQLTGHDVYHPQTEIQQAYKLAGEPKQMLSLPISQTDCYKPEGRERTIAAAVAFFNSHLPPERLA
jgi:pimeloyl-ACP methyl ester carboxylesterase